MEQKTEWITEKHLNEFKAILADYSSEDRKIILDAAEWAVKLHADQKRASGEPYVIHPLHVAGTLVRMRLEKDSIIAALLHDVLEDTMTDRAQLRDSYGTQVESLVDGVTKISILQAKNKTVQEAETIRKMLFAMIRDVRVILIKLADKLHNMMTLEYLPQNKRKNIASDCLDIYAPLAGRLGISWMKSELEDLAFKNLNPNAYVQIKNFVAFKKSRRSEYLEKIKDEIQKTSQQEAISISVETRAKHFYSIYKKMKKKGKPLNEIFDTLGIRIICNSINDCYTMLGILHRLWMPIEGRFKDYIAMPKANRYQSLHTTVMCYGGRPTEIQIRTAVMHQTAEYGIAAHWIYKEGSTKGTLNQNDIALISKLKKWNGIRSTSAEFLNEIKREILKDSIYVFTPAGDVIELPQGTTAIDFAYHIHTEVGNRCIGAKADDAIIPLTRELKNTQKIEILTSSSATPHVNWLRHVKTNRARSKIRAWLNKHDESVIIDRNIVAKKTPQPSTPKKHVPARDLPENINARASEHQQSIIDSEKVHIRIGDEKNVMIRFAKCCNPAPGDHIIGYVSRGRGIIVHKQNCRNVSSINEIDKRMIDVEWETMSPNTTRRFSVTAKKTNDLFSEIEGAIRKYKGHLIEGKIEQDERGDMAGSFTIELIKNQDYNKVLRSIRTIPSVLKIRRIPEHQQM